LTGAAAFIFERVEIRLPAELVLRIVQPQHHRAKTREYDDGPDGPRCA
jgi:hypothetical protein